MDVAFSNGEKRQYERLKPDGDGAVLVVPMLDDDTVSLQHYTVLSTFNCFMEVDIYIL
jgi:hypothetical protein